MDVAALTTTCELRFRDTANAIVSEALWLEYLNLAYMDVNAAMLALEPPAPYLELQSTSVTVSAGAGTGSIPTDAYRVTAVYNATDDVALEPLPGRGQYRHWFPDADASTGVPQFYRLRGGTIEVYPYATAATTLHVDYFGAPTALTTGEPGFPEAYHRILVHGALTYAYEDDGQLQQAEVHRARFEQQLAQMKLDMAASRTETYSEIVDDFGF